MSSNPMVQAKRIFFFLVVLVGVRLCPGAEGFKYVKNYTPKTYNLFSQNWAILQDQRGIIYAANQGGILEFDGVSWRTISIPNGTARSMAIDSNGTIFIGGIDEIGYLEPDANGTQQYVSLLAHLEERHRNFSHVYQVLCTTGATWFRTANKLFRWHDGKFTLFEPEKTGVQFKAVFSWNSDDYIQKKPEGLQKVKGNSLLPMPGSEVFSEEKIFVAVPYDNQRLLIGTRSRGFYLYDGTTVRPFPTEVDDYLKKHRLYHGIRLFDGHFALATLGGGVVVINAVGRLKEIFNKASGVLDDNVKYTFQDSSGNLWLGLNKGISKIDYTSPLSFFDDRSGLKGLVLSVARYKGGLFVGTDSGLYFLETPLPGTLPMFRSVPGLSGNCWSLLAAGDSLLAAADGGVFLVDDADTVQRMNPKIIAFVLTASPKTPGRIWVGTSNGVLTVRQEKGQWRTEYRLDYIRQIVRSMEEDHTGNLWLGVLRGGIVKVDFSGSAGDLRQAKVTPYDTAHGLPGGEVHVVRAANHVMFATSKGLFRFDESTESFVPDPTLGAEFADGSQSVFRLVEDRDKHLWLYARGRNFHAVPKYDGTFAVDTTPFLRFPRTHQVYAIYPDGQNVWFGGSDGLIRYNTAVKKNYRQPFLTLIREVTIQGRSLRSLRPQGYKETQTAAASSMDLPVLEYKDRNLHFEAAAPFFDDESSTSYQYFMEGWDEDWSEWTKDTVKDYTNLDAGQYRFRVRAKNVYGTISLEDTFSFKVLPPWYRTWWAFMVYAAAAVLMVYLIVKWRSRKLVMEKQRLEGIIEERTREIHQANTRLQQKTVLLEEQSKKLKEMDRVKSRFFANISHEFRTPLTLIMGPLDQIQSDCRDTWLKKRLNVVYRNAARLLGLINQLLDLSKLESGKMKLQVVQGDLIPFLKSILEPFELSAAQHQLTFTFHTDETSIPLYFDPEKLEKVIGNLLSNAIKFTPPGGSIALSLSSSQGYAVLSVKDTGIGIPAHQLPHVFERFYQAEAKGEYHRKGSGIGLALVKELVELHRGEITVHSEEGESRGTEFVLRFPMGSKHLRPEEMADSGSQWPEEEETPLISPSEIIEPPEYDEEMETAAVKKKVEDQNRAIILVVEDNADLRQYIRSSLEPEYSVEEAKNGREGINKAKAIIPDLIISDIMMPEVDGFELCRTVKNDISTSHIPVILLTAKASEEGMVEGLETGADDYITKPFNTRLLSARIRNLIALRRQLQLALNREMALQPADLSFSKIDREFLKDLTHVIEKNLSDSEFNVEDLSRRLYMSRATLYRKIQALSGETPTDFIRSYRLKRAVQLLKSSHFGSVTEVAFEVGFASRAYFTKCFREKFHQLPSLYLSSRSS